MIVLNYLVRYHMPQPMFVNRAVAVINGAGGMVYACAAAQMVLPAARPGEAGSFDGGLLSDDLGKPAHDLRGTCGAQASPVFWR
jgi:hypothetical protein